MGIEEHDNEGRMITLEYPDYYFINVYVPNSKRGLLRLDYRMKWEDDFLAYIKNLEKQKPVIFCGDLNVCHKEIDIANPKANLRSAGFTMEEREKFTNLLENGYIDTYRYLNPDNIIYTWWSYFAHARERNIGWRLDYFVISKKLLPNLKEAYIYNEIKHSSDDNEPTGTAGLPMLNVLEHENLNKILCIVIRYFGGIKLGAGGLIRAYTKSVTEVLKEANFLDLEKGYKINIEFSYNLEKQVNYLLKDYKIIDKKFDKTISYLVEIPENFLNKLYNYNYQIIEEIYIKKN